MNGKIITLTTSLLIASSLGASALLYKFQPEFVNDYIKINVYSPDQAYKDNEAIKTEISMFLDYNKSAVPIMINTKEDIMVLSDLEDSLFTKVNRIDVKAAITALFDDNVGPIVDIDTAIPASNIDMNTEMAAPNFDINTATPGNAEGRGKPSHYKLEHDGLSVCFLLNGGGKFEQYSEMAKCTNNKSDFLNSTGIYENAELVSSEYLTFFNDKYSHESLVDDVIGEYYYTAFSNFNAAILLGNKDHALVSSWTEEKSKLANDVNLNFSEYTVPYIAVAMREIEVGNITRESDKTLAFMDIHNKVVPGLISEFNLMSLLMHEKQVYEFQNTGRKYVFENKDVKEFLDF